MNHETAILRKPIIFGAKQIKSKQCVFNYLFTTMSFTTPLRQNVFIVVVQNAVPLFVLSCSIFRFIVFFVVCGLEINIG